MSWVFSQVAGLLWVLRVRRPLSRGATGAKVATPDGGNASASRVAAARGAPKRSGDDESVGTDRACALALCVPRQGSMCPACPGELASGPRSGLRRWPA
ncbi:MAG: hypothetical protein M3036_04085 [Bifidobacteriales bacterium]|nr:hypothetical protein [Bifidobacteriales bacterium]